MSPLVTVVTLTYNSRRYVSDAISSVLGQDFEDFELLISDDCSTDDTLKMVRAFSDERVRTTTTNQNLGPAGNYAHAFGRARGKYIAIFNSDDILLSGSLTRKISILEEDSTIGVVHSNALVIDGAGRASADTYFRSSVPDHRQEGRRTFDGISGPRIAFAFPQSFFVAHCSKPREESTRRFHTHDWELMMRLAFWADFFLPVAAPSGLPAALRQPLEPVLSLEPKPRRNSRQGRGSPKVVTALRVSCRAIGTGTRSQLCTENAEVRSRTIWHGAPALGAMKWLR